MPRKAKNKPPTHSNTCRLSYKMTSNKLSGFDKIITPHMMFTIINPEKRVKISLNQCFTKPPNNKPKPAIISLQATKNHIKKGKPNDSASEILRGSL